MITTSSARLSPYSQICIINNVYGYPIHRIGITIGGATIGEQYIYVPEIKGNRTASMG